MRNVRNLFGVLLISVLASCSNELVDVETPSAGIQTKALDVFGHRIEQSDNILNFQSTEDLEDALSKIEQAQLEFKSNSRNLDLAQGDITFINQGFRSMYDVFDEAMGVAPEYYDSQENYEVFKTKYSSLYFPEVGDDYAAYLPISDKNLAKLANADGFIKVGEELIDCKDISDYETLVNLGLTPPNEKLRSKEVFYRKEGDKKIWVNFSTGQTIGSKPSYESGLKFEVCFRDKGFMGIWYNRKASTTIQCARCDVSIIEGAKNVGNFVKKIKSDAFSSHDYFYENRVFLSGGNSGYIIHLTFGPWGSKLLMFTITKEK